jgi:hypothetical protein
VPQVGRTKPICRGADDSGSSVSPADDDHWEHMSKASPTFSAPPCLIIFGTRAAERPSGEILKYAPYGLINKPFCGSEVIRIINIAWRHWRDRYGLSVIEPEAGSAERGTVHSTEE